MLLVLTLYSSTAVMFKWPIVSLLWANVIGGQATTTDKAPYINLQEIGMTPGAIVYLAADTSFNTNNIKLVGLATTGFEYIPVNLG